MNRPTPVKTDNFFLLIFRALRHRRVPIALRIASHNVILVALALVIYACVMGLQFKQAMQQQADAQAQQESDAICTALQLINFWQDIAVDWQKDRVYLPQTDLTYFGISEAQIAESRWTTQWEALLAFQTQRARELMLSGTSLVHQLPGRMGWEIRFTVQGGLRILEKIDQARGDVFRQRPLLRPADWLLIGSGALFM